MGSAMMVFSTLAILLFGAAAVAADGPITAKLTLDPSRTLPGLPVAFRVTVENVSTRALKISRIATLDILTEDGATFQPRWGHGTAASNYGSFAADELTSLR